MAERREPGFDIEQLDDPVPTLQATSPQVAQQVPRRKAGGSGSATGFLVFLVLILFVAAAALGYWGMLLKRDMDEQGILIEQMNLWLESTDASLSQASNSASQSGETLRGRLEQMDERLEERIKHFDSEIAKLWTISYQRNKPQLEAQAEQLAANAETLNALQASLTEQSATLGVLRDEQTKQIAAVSGIQVTNETLSGQFDQQSATVKSVVEKAEALAAQIGEIQTGLEQADARISQVVADVEFQLSVERDERAKLQADMQRTAAQSGGNAALEARVKELEGLIAGIDASRRSLTAKLLELQNQISTQ